MQGDASMEAESAGVTLARAEIAHPRSGSQTSEEIPSEFHKECEQEILGGMFAFTHHHQIDDWNETNSLHLRIKSYGHCSDCNSSTQYLFNYGSFLYWRRCPEHMSSRERILYHALREQRLDCIVSEK